jgi:hypothetical protein
MPTKTCQTCGKTYTVGNPGPGCASHLYKNPDHQRPNVPKKDKVKAQKPGNNNK